MDMLEIKYWKENKSLKDISKELGVCSATVLYRMKKKEIPRRESSQAAKEKTLITLDFSQTSNLSYIIGVLLGDGCISASKKNLLQKHIILQAVDEEFVDAFRLSLYSIGLHPCKYVVKARREGRSDAFRICAQSVNFYNWYESLSREEIRQLVFNYPIEFIRGFYDSEGSLYSHWRRDKNKEKPRLTCQVRIGNTEEWVINLFRDLADYLGFHFRKRKIKSKQENRKDVYEIALGRREDVLRFLKEIKPSISRKSIQKYYSVLAEKEKNPELYAKIREE